MAFRALSESPELRFTDRAFDVRGWDVRTMADDAEVGEVDDILVDDTGAPRYLDVELGLLRRHVLLPIGQARVDAEDEVVWIPGMTRDQLGAVPAYDHDPGRLSRDYESRVVGAYSGALEGPTYSATLGTPSGRLARLDELEDFRIADGDPDIRGWDLRGADGARMGRVDELIVDAAAMKVRYMSVELDEELTGAGAERHVLVPIGYARLDEDAGTVFVDALDASRLRALPDFTGRLSREYEEDLTSALTTDREGFYAHPRFDAGSFYGPRQLSAEDARVAPAERRSGVRDRRRPR